MFVVNLGAPGARGPGAWGPGPNGPVVNPPLDGTGATIVISSDHVTKVWHMNYI